MAETGIDTRDLKAFASTIRKASKATGKKFRQAELKAAAIVAEDAKARIESTSSKVADTIKPFTVGASAGVQTGSADVPQALLLEVGNSGSVNNLVRSARSGSFRHPVFGGDVWVSQPMHPYLGPAAEAKQAEALELLVKGVNEAFAEVHLEWE